MAASNLTITFLHLHSLPLQQPQKDKHSTVTSHLELESCRFLLCKGEGSGFSLAPGMDEEKKRKPNPLKRGGKGGGKINATNKSGPDQEQLFSNMWCMLHNPEAPTAVTAAVEDTAKAECRLLILIAVLASHRG